MAKQRMINTKFWSDGFIRENLNPLDRYLFLYFLTNEKTNISGVYELPLSTISSETGIERDMLKKMIVRLKSKIYYLDGWVYIRNFQKHQSTTSTTVKRGIEIEMSKIPSKIKEKIDELDKKLEGIDRVSGGIIYPNLNSNLNLNPNTESTSDSEGIKSHKKIYNIQGSEIIKAFEEIDVKNKRYYGNTTQRSACDFLIEEYGLEQVLELIPKLKETNKKSVWQITTPQEMVDKITKVFNDVQRKQVELTSKGRGLA